eukprot:m.112707 g.112707  ORF g.112707 m.112707 type:complete len:255 (+) comp17035_c0_seq2:170-934(+)
MYRGQVVWDAGLVLASHIAEQFHGHATLAKRAVVELGAGPGIPGVVAALCGASVLLTDLQPTLFEVTAPNADANRLALKGKGPAGGGSLAIAELWWGEEFPPGVPVAPDMILGADIVFDEEHFPALIATVKQLLPPTARDTDPETSTAGSEPHAGGKNAASTPSGKKTGGRQRRHRQQQHTAFQKCALFSYRARTRCARHGCDTALFFDMLKAEGYSVTDVEIPPESETGRKQRLAAAVSPTATQAIYIVRVAP